MVSPSTQIYFTSCANREWFHIGKTDYLTKRRKAAGKKTRSLFFVFLAKRDCSQFEK